MGCSPRIPGKEYAQGEGMVFLLILGREVKLNDGAVRSLKTRTFGPQYVPGAGVSKMPSHKSEDI